MVEIITFDSKFFHLEYKYNIIPIKYKLEHKNIKIILPKTILVIEMWQKCIQDKTKKANMCKPKQKNSVLNIINQY